jgi:ribosomal protein S18 acetylase RimI-like enzyme
MYTIKTLDKLSPDTQRKMDKDLLADEYQHGIDVNYKNFSFIMRNEQNETVGVLNASTVYSEIYIDDLWVHSAYQKRGYGRKLMEYLEEHFKGQGFNNINLVTSQFQAPEFYQKLGFELEFIRKNLKNPQLTKFFFVKYFTDAVQMQGILSKT